MVRLHLLTSAAIAGVLARDDRDLRMLLRIGLPSTVGLVFYALYAGYLTGRWRRHAAYTCGTPSG